jgi:hypothetical protein
MAIEPVRVMIFPRYSSLVGDWTFHTAPMNVRPYFKVVFTVWRGDGIHIASDGMDVEVQVSNDLRYWDTLTSWSPTATQEEVHSSDLDREWMRLAVTLAEDGGDPSVPLWLLAELLPRGE